MGVVRLPSPWERTDELKDPWSELERATCLDISLQELASLTMNKPLRLSVCKGPNCMRLDQENGKEVLGLGAGILYAKELADARNTIHLELLSCLQGCIAQKNRGIREPSTSLRLSFVDPNNPTTLLQFRLVGLSEEQIAQALQIIKG